MRAKPQHPMKFNMLILCLLHHPLAYAADVAKPNIIFILTDDQGWGDAKFAGHDPAAHTLR